MSRKSLLLASSVYLDGRKGGKLENEAARRAQGSDRYFLKPLGTGSKSRTRIVAYTPEHVPGEHKMSLNPNFLEPVVRHSHESILTVEASQCG